MSAAVFAHHLKFKMRKDSASASTVAVTTEIEIL